MESYVRDAMTTLHVTDPTRDTPFHTSLRADARNEARTIAEVTISGALETHLQDAALQRNSFHDQYNSLMLWVNPFPFLCHLPLPFIFANLL